MEKLSKAFWNQRYEEESTPWDIGNISPPLKTFIDTIEDKSLKILIPGAGRAYEAIYLVKEGFENVFVCDWAEKAFDYLKSQVPNFPSQNLLVSDFFELDITVDLILEQTFFCAIDPALREKYVKKVASLLSPNGQIAGLLFSSEFSKAGPPFGGTEKEYKSQFEPYFKIKQLQTAQNSIQPRYGNELFFNMIKL